jgi:hypothetical protein
MQLSVRSISNRVTRLCETMLVPAGRLQIQMPAMGLHPQHIMQNMRATGLFGSTRDFALNFALVCMHAPHAP